MAVHFPYSDTDVPLTRLRRVLLAGLACGFAAGVGGLAMERVRLGASDRAAFARVEADVRSQFDAIVASLRSVSAALARADAIERASIAAGDAARLMDAVERAPARAAAVAAVTVFGADRTPLAWSGRPSELPPSRTDGPEAFFTVPGRPGARLVHVLPVTAGDPARRIGTIASEWSLTGGAEGVAADTIRFDSFVPVSLRARPEGAGAPPGTTAFILYSPTGEPLLEASTSTDALMAARRNWRRGVVNLVLAILAATLIVGAGSLLQLGRAGRSRSRYLWPTAGAAGLLALARALLWLALAGPWAQPPLLDAPPASMPGAILFRSAIDLLFSAIALVGVVAVAADAVDRLRLIRGRPRRPRPWTMPALLPLVVAQVAAGALAGAGVRLCQRGLEDALLTTSLDIVHFSLYPLDTQRIALALSLVALHAAIVWSAVVVFRAALLPWRISARDAGATAVVGAAWAGGLLAVGVLVEPAVAPALWAGGTAILIAMTIGRWRARYRHASQAFRLVAGALAVIVPAVGMYPTLLRVATRAARQVVETQFGPEARDQRERIQERVQRSAGQVDRLPGLADLVEAGGPVSSRTAYAIWSSTDLGSPGLLLTSSVEVYGSDGSLASRFAFNLPEDPGAPGEWTGQECGWQTYEEVSSFASDERRLLFSGRALCRPDGRRAGAIVLRAMLDYDALSFISARSLPYELLRADPPRAREGVFGRDVEFVVYGWSRRPIYTSSGSAWRLDDGTFARLTRTRDPLWVTASKDDRDYDVHLLSDRAGIYAVGLPRLAALDHLINLAEITVLAAVLYVLICAAAMLFSTITGLGPASGRALLREIRASFYRKLFLAFVLASLVPVGALAFVLRAFIVTEARSTLEASAVRTAATAQRVIEDYSTLSQRGATGLPNVDDLMVGISRAMGQDVNVFDGPALWATSKRFLYESRLLPERTPASVYRAIVLERRSSFVDEERADEVRYMVAAAPVTGGKPQRDRHRPARAAAAGDRTRRRGAEPPHPPGGRPLRAVRRRRRVFDGRAHRRSRQPPHARDTADRPRRPRRPRPRDLVGRAALAHGRLQFDGGRAAASARRTGALAPCRRLGGNGTAGGARDQEPADADSAIGRASPPAAPRSRPAAHAGARGVRDRHPLAGPPAAADCGGVLGLCLLADGAPRADAARRPDSRRGLARTGPDSPTASASPRRSRATCRSSTWIGRCSSAP